MLSTFVTLSFREQRFRKQRFREFPAQLALLFRQQTALFLVSMYFLDMVFESGVGKSPLLLAGSRSRQ